MGRPVNIALRRGGSDTRLGRFALLALCLPLLIGCASTDGVSLRSVPRSPLVERFQLTSWSGPQPSSRTIQVLRRYDLESELQNDPQVLLTKLQAQANADPRPETIYSIAELSFLAAKEVEEDNRQAALNLYGSSVTNAYQYLFDRRYGTGLNPYDPQFRGACDLYNGSLEGALRILSNEGQLSPGRSYTIRSGEQSCEVKVVAPEKHWNKDDFERFEFASDFEIEGLRNQYRTFGLGVPLIGIRKSQPGNSDDRFYPPNLSIPVTAFLRVMPNSTEPPTAGAIGRAQLELYDPLNSTDLAVNAVKVPLESDLTTPLAYFLKNKQLVPLATIGLLRPDEGQKLRGLYMAQPYEADKVPVLFVHGLWSDPTTWTEMFNDLRSFPEVRARYQFWFYLYPSGQPFWHSAAQMRTDLAEMRHSIDPQQQAAALDQMVLVGHSMGGLVSKLQTIESGNAVWEKVSNQPFETVKADDDIRKNLSDTYFFEPNPSIRRVITIGTPHRGSEFANSTIRYIGSKFITLPKMLKSEQKRLGRDNPDYFPEDSLLWVNTSIDSLAPESPILPLMLEAEHPPTVQYHNIVGITELDQTGVVPEDGTDGVVAYASAHLGEVESELPVAADHLGVHRHPLSVLEVRRILLEHWEEIRQAQDPVIRAYSAPGQHTAGSIVPPGPSPNAATPVLEPPSNAGAQQTLFAPPGAGLR